MPQLISAIGGTTFPTVGIYAQTYPGQQFTGDQLTSRVSQVIASNAILEAAVMPMQGFEGYTSSDDSQAQNVADVMAQLLSMGVKEISLRWAHEANYYVTDGTYSGTAADFKEGWTTVANAVRAKCGTKVKMFWTPNCADPGTYAEWAPDMSLVDLVGVDCYPKSASDTFLSLFQDFHDTYTTADIKFAIGETGLGYDGSDQEKMAWLQEATSTATKAAMPNFISLTWFNYYKGYNFKVVDPDDSTVTGLFKTYVGL